MTTCSRALIGAILGIVIAGCETPPPPYQESLIRTPVRYSVHDGRVMYVDRVFYDVAPTREPTRGTPYYYAP